MSEAPLQVSHDTLRSLHRLHEKLADLYTRQARGPRQVKASEAAVEAMSEALNERRATLKQFKIASDQKQLQLKEREQHIANLEMKLNTAASNREFQSFKDQIAADQQANGVLSDEILEGFDAIDSLARSVSEHEEKLRQRQADHESLAAEMLDKQKTIVADIDRVEKELAEAEKSLPAQIMETYRRQTESQGEDALAEVEGSSCSNCGTTLSPQMMNRLMLSHFLTCSSCAAILYLNPDSQ